MPINWWFVNYKLKRLPDYSQLIKGNWPMKFWAKLLNKVPYVENTGINHWTSMTEESLKRSINIGQQLQLTRTLHCKSKRGKINIKEYEPSDMWNSNSVFPEKPNITDI